MHTYSKLAFFKKTQTKGILGNLWFYQVYVIFLDYLVQHDLVHICGIYYTFELPSQSEIKVATMVRDHKQKPTNNKTHGPFL